MCLCALEQKKSVYIYKRYNKINNFKREQKLRFI